MIVVVSFILFWWSLNKACFLLIKLLFLEKEAGGIDKSDITDVSG